MSMSGKQGGPATSSHKTIRRARRRNRAGIVFVAVGALGASGLLALVFMPSRRDESPAPIVDTRRNEERRATAAKLVEDLRRTARGRTADVEGVLKRAAEIAPQVRGTDSDAALATLAGAFEKLRDERDATRAEIARNLAAAKRLPPGDPQAMALFEKAAEAAATEIRHCEWAFKLDEEQKLVAREREAHLAAYAKAALVEYEALSGKLDALVAGKDYGRALGLAGRYLTAYRETEWARKLEGRLAHVRRDALIASGWRENPDGTASASIEVSGGQVKANMKSASAADCGMNQRDPTTLIFARPGGSALSATFVLAGVPAAAVLEIEHLSSSVDSAKFGGNSRITIRLNGEAVVTEWEVGEHGTCVDRLAIAKLLREGDNSLELRFAAGETVYWLKRLEVRCAFAPPRVERAPAVEGERSLTFDGRKSTMQVKLSGCRQDGQGVAFLEPAGSVLRADFELPSQAGWAALEIEHLCATVQGARFGGSARISVFVNGDPLVREWEVGAHEPAIDRLAMGKMLRAGANTLEVRTIGGDARYELRRLDVRWVPK